MKISKNKKICILSNRAYFARDNDDEHLKWMEVYMFGRKGKAFLATVWDTGRVRHLNVG